MIETNPKFLQYAHQLFHKCIEKNECLYKPLTLHEFKNKLISSNQSFHIKNYFDVVDDNLRGFISGIILENQNKAYITLLMVDANYRHLGIGSSLLKEFESTIKTLYPNIRTIDIVFYNPIHFEWIVPNTINHDHPNTPGVDLDSTSYLFFTHHGYKTFAKQNSYYRDIKHYTLSNEVKSLVHELKTKEIEITFYDQNFHEGFRSLCEDLNNPLWYEAITHGISRGEPVLIAAKKNQIIGFTGPLYIQPSKRGYFAGIGVHQDYRGYGIGKALFAFLCLNLSQMGADFMTLFTGETNPARHIYEKESFKIVKSWANMRKEI